MKTPMILLTAALGIAGCTSGSNQKPSAEDTAMAEAAARSDSIPGPACYLSLQGTTAQDTTWLRLEFSGSDVSGELNWIPSGKDSRKGSIRATKSGNLVKGVWTFMQEGMEDTLSVEFQLAGRVLYQRAYRYDSSTGRQYLDEKGAFDKEFKRVDCP